MGDNAKAMVLASFIGDALALGVHWIYEQSLIASAHGRLTGLTDPPPGSYHPGKTAGERSIRPNKLTVATGPALGQGDMVSFS